MNRPGLGRFLNCVRLCFIVWHFFFWEITGDVVDVVYGVGGLRAGRAFQAKAEQIRLDYVLRSFVQCTVLCHYLSQSREQAKERDMCGKSYVSN